MGNDSVVHVLLQTAQLITMQMQFNENISASAGLRVCMSICHYLSVGLCVCLSVCQSVCLSVSHTPTETERSFFLTCKTRTLDSLSVLHGVDQSELDHLS